MKLWDGILETRFSVSVFLSEIVRNKMKTCSTVGWRSLGKKINEILEDELVYMFSLKKLGL